MNEMSVNRWDNSQCSNYVYVVVVFFKINQTTSCTPVSCQKTHYGTDK